MSAPTVTENEPGDSDEPNTGVISAATKTRPRRLRVPRRDTLLRLAAAVVGGVLLYLSFPPRPVWWLAPVAFTLLALAVYGRRARAGFGYGFLFGLGFLIPLLHWTGLYVGIIAWWPLSAFESLFIGLAVAAIAVVSTLRGFPLWAALLWIVGEALRSRVPFGGLPWGKVAFGQPDGGYISLAAVGGTPLVGFAVTLTGFGLAALLIKLWAARTEAARTEAARTEAARTEAARTEAARTEAARTEGRRWSVRPVALLGSALAVLVPIGASAAAWPLVGTDPNAGTATVAAIQGNVPRLGLDFNAQRRAVLDNHVKETEKLAAEVAAHQVPQPQLVIWPENSSDIDPYANADAYAEISQAAATIHAPISVGAVVSSQEPGPKNTAILWQPGQGPVDQYVKRQLQPFGETMPWRSFFRLFSATVDRAGRFVPGDKPVVFSMGPAKVGLDTCYEVAFDSVVRDSVPGSNLLAVPTNNATFGLSEMTYQQLAMDQERAVESGRSVIVAATSGVSAIIMPDGTVTQQTQLFTANALVATVPLRSTTTLADRVGAWPEWIMVVAGLLSLAFGVTVRVRARRSQHAS